MKCAQVEWNGEGGGDVEAMMMCGDREDGDD